MRACQAWGWKQLAKDRFTGSKSFVVSVIMHVIFFTALVTTMSVTVKKPAISVNLQADPKDPTIIKASLIDKNSFDVAQQLAEQRKIEQQKAEQLKQEELARKQQEEEAAQQKLRLAQEQAQQQKLAQEKAAQEKLVKQKLAQEKIAQEKIAQQKIVEQKIVEQKIAEQKAQQKLQLQKVEQQKLAKQKKDQELKAQQLAAKQAEDLRAQQAAAAAAALKAKNDKIAAEQQAFLASEVDRYRAAFQAAVEDNRILSGVFTGDISCTIRIRLLPDGSIASVQIIESSGNPAYDEMSTNAVYKSAPFPMPPDQELYAQLRDIVLSFKNGEQSSDVL